MLPLFAVSAPYHSQSAYDGIRAQKPTSAGILRARIQI